MTIRERKIPSADYKDWKASLELRNYRVLGCTPDASDPNFCLLRFEEPDSAATATAARALASADAMAAMHEAVQPEKTLTALQVKTAQAIVNIFETSQVLGDYSQVTVIPEDTGHLTYGRSQTTLGSGNLYLLLQRYCANAGARFAQKLTPYLNRVSQRDLSLDNDVRLHNLLRASADDPVMRDTQDAFFHAVYWLPALRTATAMGIGTPLGVAVVYDSYVHGSWEAMRDRTNHDAGTVASLGEKGWITAYVATRWKWLATHARSDLRATVYRMEAFRRLIDQGYWGLPLPLAVRGREISEATLNANPPGCYDGPQPGTRMLALQTPMAQGLDVRLVQLGLSELGMDIRADGLFGQTTLGCIRQYQSANGLAASGIADIALIARLTA